MTVVNTDPAAQRAPWAKARILEVADELFYSDGIRAVGIDRLISESSVTKATFYKHYGSKDRLIVAYVEGRRQAEREALEKIASEYSGGERAIRGLVAWIVADIARPGFRGCALINAAVEFPDPAHPVRQIVTQHRDWYTGYLVDLLHGLGHHMAGDAADELLLARDGAMSGGYAGDPVAASAALARAANRVIESAAS